MGDKITYFLRGEGASIIVEPGTAEIIAKASPAGVFATVKPDVIKALEAIGYKRVTEELLEQLGYTVPPPDKLDWSRWDNPKYKPFV